jgi:putative transcriptional regulator
MAIIKGSLKRALKELKNMDWKRFDAMTDEDIARQIASNPDAAPDMSRALRNGEFHRPIKPKEIKAVRRKTGLSQSRFAAWLHINVATVRNWEQGRTQPDGAAVALLTLIDREPKLAMRTLQE